MSLPRGSKAIVEYVAVIVLAVVLALGIQAFLVKPYRIPSPSMEPTLDIGQRVLVNRVGTHFGDPSVGDVIVFHPPDRAKKYENDPDAQCLRPRAADSPCTTPGREQSDVNYVKRVVAVGGDRISIRNGHVVLNGKEQPVVNESCAGRTGMPCDLPHTVTVPEGHLFMMGDNRGDSDDSRYWGPIPQDWVIGRVFATYWPVKRIGPM